MDRILLDVSLAALAAPALARSSLTVPHGSANTVGNGDNEYPWNRGAASMRFQQVYAGSNFPLQGLSSGVLIQGMTFRPCPGPVTTRAGGSWSNVRVDMATCPVDILAVTRPLPATSRPTA